MKILCDENVPNRYYKAIEDHSELEVARTVDIFGKETPDLRISQFATDKGYIVLTRDVDFFANDPDHGILYFGQAYDPKPAELVGALVRIDNEFQIHAKIRQSVTEWID